MTTQQQTTLEGNRICLQTRICVDTLIQFFKTVFCYVYDLLNTEICHMIILNPYIGFVLS